MLDKPKSKELSMETSATYWQDLLKEWQAAVRTRNIESFFLNTVENRNNQRTVYQNLGSITAYTEYLVRQAANEIEYGNDPLQSNVIRNTTWGVGEY